MKKTVLCLVMACSVFAIQANAQVGINIPNPTSTLDVTAKNASGTTTNVDGVLVPRVDRQRAQSMTAVPTSTLIYVNDVSTGTQTGTAINIDVVGHYSYNGTAWTKLTPLNIYTGDGTIASNRIVTMAANNLTFTGTTGAFQVNGNNNGFYRSFFQNASTGASSRMDVNIGAGAANIYLGADNGAAIFGAGVKAYLDNRTAGRLVFASNGREDMTVDYTTGNVGMGISTPTNRVDVNGTARVRTITPVAGTTPVTPVYADATGVLVKGSPSAAFGTLTSNIVTVASGAEVPFITGLIDGSIYKVVVIAGDGCADVATAEYYVHNYSQNSFYAIGGISGMVSMGSPKTPTFNQSVRNVVGTSWTGVIGCQDGGGPTGLNYTLTVPAAGSINITNNGNVTRTYYISATRMN